MERIDDTVGMEPFEKALASIEPTDLDDTASQITLSDSAAQKYSKNRFAKQYRSLFKWKPPDNDFDPIPPFDIDQAWTALLSLPSCQQFMLKPHTQKRMNLVVGVNITQEFPWKHLPLKSLSPMFNEISHSKFYYDAFQNYDPNDHVLLGYVPIITQSMEDPPEGDPFVLFVNPADTKLALCIIRNLEIYERLIYDKKFIKRAGVWNSLGSEGEIFAEGAPEEVVSVEIQSVYPMSIPSNKEFSVRLSTDVRDGYVELVPRDDVRFENVIRKRVSIGIQAVKAVRDTLQQTDPTFPTNAWAQYLYEIEENDEGLDPDSEDEESKDKKTGGKTAATTVVLNPAEKPPPELSDNVKFLLSQLEFNQIDLYRNDYLYICDSNIEHYTTPSLEETLCFANISKSNERFVCGCDWYPALAGLVVTSYTFSTPSTQESAYAKVDYVRRAVLDANPILLWSFSDNLNYKFEFESPREVTTLSFCPYNANLLFGGTKNGQIYLWDLQDRAEKMDYQEMLTAAQARYRAMTNDFLKWTIPVNEDMLVSPVSISKLETSPTAAITGIQWFGRRTFINSFGKVYTVSDRNAKYRFFVTCSFDGSIAFWNLDAESNKKTTTTTNVNRDLPKALTQSESAYKSLALAPVYVISYNEPITGMIADTPVLHCRPKEAVDTSKNIYNYRTETVFRDSIDMRHSIVVSTFYGHLEKINWQGAFGDSEGKEIVHNTIPYARVHDGPVVAMAKNPFFPWLFASIGRNILAVWKEDFTLSPIFWRKRQNDLTAVSWSETKPSVLYLSRIDGSLEAWDILSRDDNACLNDVLGGGIVTKISEHKPFDPEKLLGIGDYNSSLRMIKLPPSLYKMARREERDLKAYILKEEARKKAIFAWENNYFEKNKEFIEMKRKAEIETHKEMERLEKEQLYSTAQKAKEEEQENKAPPRLAYSERMKIQWYELNLKRLLSILMSRKRVNEEQLKQETVLEKEHLAYEAAKKVTLNSVLSNVASELATVRANILPHEVPDLQRNDMIMSTVNEIFNEVETYEEIEAQADEIFKHLDKFHRIDYTDFIVRGTKRRKNLNKELGANTSRQYWYEEKCRNRELDTCNWGFEENETLLDMYDAPSVMSMELTPHDEGEEEQLSEGSEEHDAADYISQDVERNTI